MSNSANKTKSGKENGGSGPVIKENPGGLSRSEPMPLSKSLLSLEPALVIHMCSAILVFMTVQDLLLEKACRVNLGYSDDVCDALQARNTKGLEEQEQKVQTLMGQAVVWRTVLENAFPIVLVFLVGAWSDKYGRKYPMLFVLSAFILQDILLIISVLAGNLAGTWTVAIISSVVVSLSGNQACFISSAFSYTSDHTPVEKRTVRTGILHSLVFLGITLGLAAGGILAKSGLGFIKIFALAMALESFSLVYLVISMKNRPLPGVTKGKSNTDMFMELFNFQHIKDAASCIMKKREGNTRLKLGLLLLSHACVFMPMMGEMGVLYLFCRYQFNWDAATFGSFMSYKTVVGFIGNFVSMGVLAGKLKLTDPQNGIVACISNLVAALMFSVATSSFLMFLGPIVSLLAGAAMIVPRSMLSKIIPADELGKINSCIGSMESIIPLVASSVYTLVYTSFLDVLPGSFFLISAGLTIPPTIVFLWFMQEDSKTSKLKAN
ncbi:Proton-coupled folate transporter [Orchesella cincta]|uniref:Proton-coupled folate transporter n=1 Tax=Orchesella cincta TaxID=48709 RepID=A0A1D2MP92_ORCCI|nr:Proton-coupled folate transporter [Orchesella cincta]